MQKRLVSLFSIAFACVSANVLAQSPFTGKPQYQIEVKRADTVMGRIIVEMFPAIAPMSVRNWDSLVGIHFYDSTAFHRVIPGFMIQGGDPNSRSGDPSTWGYGDPSQTTVDAEFSAVSHRRGILSAARTPDPNSATSQFFICVGNPTYLDRKYSVYGHVISGMDIVDSIVMAPRDTSQQRNRPWVKISMFITRLGSNDSVPFFPPQTMPPAGFISSSQRVTFKWGLIPGVMMYELQISTDSAFQNIYADSTYSQVTSSSAISKIPFGKYYWRMQSNNGGNLSEFSPAMPFTVASATVADQTATTFSFDEAYPNPSDGNSTIHFNLDRSSIVKISLLDELGRTEQTIINGERIEAGDHEIALPKLATGVYLCRLEANGESAIRKVIVR